MESAIGFIAQPLGVLLSFLYGFIQNYGITLLVFTLIVKVCLYPLYAKQVKTTVRMSEMQPKMKELQAKYANDKQMLNSKMMEMYKKEKFNPMAGCLPMLLQMPIIFALFMLLRNPTRFMPGDEMLVATHESFFWMMDLSQPDPWIMPVLAAATTFFSFVQTAAQQGPMTEANAAMAPMMKMMKYFFPMMILVMGRSFPAGLIIYWFFGQAVQIVFNLHLNKVRKKLKEESEMRRRSQL
jgi:YidC/Oxa1 family membrane protein insertase